MHVLDRIERLENIIFMVDWRSYVICPFAGVSFVFAALLDYVVLRTFAMPLHLVSHFLRQ